MGLVGAVVALAVLAYTYFGYPIAIWALARVFPVGRRRAGGKDEGNADVALPMVSVCLPVFNGVHFLPEKIQSLLAEDYPRDRLEILVYCDGCTDDSEQVARALAAAPGMEDRMRVFSNPARRGKPTALNTLCPAARGDLLLLNDARQPLSSNAVRALVLAMGDENVGCATGNLMLKGAAGSGVYWRYENWIRKQESRFRGVLGVTGPLAMMRRADFRPLPDDVILDDMWIPMQLGLAGKRVAFVAAAEAYDTAFEDDREFQRKARTLAGNYQLFARMPALLNPFVNPFWFETISHKILRLVAPWLMLVLAVSSLTAALCGPIGGAPAMRALVLAQVAFYAAALLGRRAGRLGGLARTFVVLNSAAVVGLLRHLTGSQRITW